MSNDESQEGKGFKVQDRRRFTAEGETKEDAPQETTSDAAATANASADGGPSAPASEPSTPPPHPPRGEPMQINFTTFVISFGTQALAFLGEIPSPVDGTMNVDLIAAKEMIDIIAMLQDKTKGNLDEAEAGLLQSLLYDLRVKYVERARRQGNRG